MYLLKCPFRWNFAYICFFFSEYLQFEYRLHPGPVKVIFSLTALVVSKNKREKKIKLAVSHYKFLFFILITNRFNSAQHVFNFLRNEAAQLQEIFLASSWLLLFSFCALHFYIECTTKVLINQRTETEIL